MAATAAATAREGARGAVGEADAGPVMHHADGTEVRVTVVGRV